MKLYFYIFGKPAVKQIHHLKCSNDNKICIIVQKQLNFASFKSFKLPLHYDFITQNTVDKKGCVYVFMCYVLKFLQFRKLY